VSPRGSPEECGTRAERLGELHDIVEDRGVAVVLVAPEGQAFDGVALWDALASLGLHWGDMGLNHYENDSGGPGDDHIFSVGTSAAPGYFLPEEAVRLGGDEVVGPHVPGSTKRRGGSPARSPKSENPRAGAAQYTGQPAG